MYQQILCPVDGSETSHSGMQEAILLAKTLNAQLRFLYVIDLYFPIMNTSGEIDMVYIDDILRKHGQKVLLQAEEDAKIAGVKADSKLAETIGHRVSTLILDEAKSWPADLIIMGTHGLRGIERIVMGSDAESVVRKCSVPVLLVKNKDKTA